MRAAEFFRRCQIEPLDESSVYFGAVSAGDSGARDEGSASGVWARAGVDGGGGPHDDRDRRGG